MQSVRAGQHLHDRHHRTPSLRETDTHAKKILGEALQFKARGEKMEHLEPCCDIFTAVFFCSYA